MIALEGALLTEWVAITGSSVTTVLTATQRTTIASIVVCPTTGSPNLSVSKYNGTTRYYKFKAKPMTAGTPYVWDTPFSLDPGNVLEITSSSGSGDMDVEINYVVPTAAAQQRGQ